MAVADGHVSGVDLDSDIGRKVEFEALQHDVRGTDIEDETVPLREGTTAPERIGLVLKDVGLAMDLGSGSVRVCAAEQADIEESVFPGESFGWTVFHAAAVVTHGPKRFESRKRDVVHQVAVAFNHHPTNLPRHRRAVQVAPDVGEFELEPWRRGVCQRDGAWLFGTNHHGRTRIAAPVDSDGPTVCTRRKCDNVARRRVFKDLLQLATGHHWPHSLWLLGVHPRRRSDCKEKYEPQITLMFARGCACIHLVPNICLQFVSIWMICAESATVLLVSLRVVYIYPYRAQMTTSNHLSY